MLIRLHTQTGAHEPDMGWSLIFIFVNGNLVESIDRTFALNKRRVDERSHGNMLLDEQTHAQHMWMLYVQMRREYKQYKYY